MVYDHERDFITFLDVSRIHDSFNNEEEPLSDGTQDVAHVEENLIRVTSGILTEAEFDQILTQFYSAYTTRATHPLKKPLIKFHRLFRKLQSLARYGGDLETDDSDQQKKIIFQRTLDYFAKQISIQNCDQN